MSADCDARGGGDPRVGNLVGVNPRAQDPLAPLLALLPDLAVVVLSGRVAGMARETIAVLRPGLPVVAIPHPSPTYVCTAPDVAARIRAGSFVQSLGK